MVGRLLNHQGRQRNIPTVRFGDISMMPWEPILNQRGLMQESFLVEMRSLSGYSGSPVFVTVDGYTPRPVAHKGGEIPMEGGGTWLLGIDWGHLRTYGKVVSEKDKQTPIEEDWVVPSNSGQAMVVPAWKLRELLDQEELVVRRKQLDDKLTEVKKSSPAAFDAKANAEGPSQSAQHPDSFTEEDFEDALDRASRHEQPSDRES